MTHPNMEKPPSASSSFESSGSDERLGNQRLVRFEFGPLDEDNFSLPEEPLEGPSGRLVSPAVEAEIRHHNRLRRVAGFTELVRRDMQQEGRFNNSDHTFTPDFLPEEWENNGTVDREEPYPDVAHPVPTYTALPGEGESTRERSLSEQTEDQELGHLPLYEEIFHAEQSEMDMSPASPAQESSSEEELEPLEEAGAYGLYSRADLFAYERPSEEFHTPRRSPRMLFIPLVAGLTRTARRMHNRVKDA